MKAITNLFEESVSKYRDNVFLWEKKNSKFEGTTYEQTHQQVYRLAAGLMKLGLAKGDRVALLSEGSNNWVISEMAILYCAAVDVPLSIKLGEPSEIAFRVVHSGARYIMVSRNQLKKVRPIAAEINSLEKIILLDEEENLLDKEINLSRILALGDDFLATHAADFEERWKSVVPDDYANICYTSGTTADPKGIILSHRNYTANVEQALSLMNIPSHFTSLLILPLDHSFAHTAGIFTLMTTGASMATVQVGKSGMDTLKNIPVNIKEIKPHFLLSVPSLAKNFRKNIEGSIREKGPVLSKLFAHALKVAYTYNGIGWDRGRGWRIILKPYYALFDIILFKKVREAFGGRLEFFIGGGALLDIELQRFFYAIGIPMYQGYGLSESSPIISSNSVMRHKLGSSGFLVTPMDLKICDADGNELPVGEKGEIVVRGENIMKGYWNNPKATADALKEGWLYTGDMGYMDKDGFLYVLGRFKSLLIADDGEKYSPEGIEEAFVNQSQFVDQCMLYNSQNPYTVMLLVPNKEAIKRWLKAHHHDATAEEGQIAALKMLESEINEYRSGNKYADMFPQRWLPSAIGVIEEGFTEENHLMNSTMKVVRPKVTERYAERLKSLYNPEAKDITNALNRQVIAKWLAG